MSSGEAWRHKGSRFRPLGRDARTSVRHFGRRASCHRASRAPSAPPEYPERRRSALMEDGPNPDRQRIRRAPPRPCCDDQNELPIRRLRCGRATSCDCLHRAWLMPSRVSLESVQRNTWQTYCPGSWEAVSQQPRPTSCCHNSGEIVTARANQTIQRGPTRDHRAVSGCGPAALFPRRAASAWGVLPRREGRSRASDSERRGRLYAASKAAPM